MRKSLMNSLESREIHGKEMLKSERKSRDGKPSQMLSDNMVLKINYRLARKEIEILKRRETKGHKGYRVVSGIGGKVRKGIMETRIEEKGKEEIRREGKATGKIEIRKKDREVQKEVKIKLQREVVVLLQREVVVHPHPQSLNVHLALRRFHQSVSMSKVQNMHLQVMV